LTGPFSVDVRATLDGHGFAATGSSGAQPTLARARTGHTAFAASISSRNPPLKMLDADALARPRGAEIFSVHDMKVFFRNDAIRLTSHRAPTAPTRAQTNKAAS